MNGLLSCRRNSDDHLSSLADSHFWFGDNPNQPNMENPTVFVDLHDLSTLALKLLQLIA